jgi:PPK2 family polyphosphate:nucleotide phosphotransferase
VIDLTPPQGKAVRLKDYPTGNATDLTKENALQELVGLRQRLNELQNLLYADRRFAVLVILQAIDAGGKDGTIRSVFQDVGPLGCSVISFKVPTEEELDHDYLWRIHQHTPGKGHLTIFNRSQYEDVLVVRVRKLAPKSTWEKRYDQINNFERTLTDEGTIIMKFYLHVSKDEQRKRLQERVDDPKKRWKFRKGDLDDRTLWDDYQQAFEAMLDRCNTDYAPWHIVPADHNWLRDLLVARTLVKKLESLDLRYPDPEEGIAGTVVV